LDKSVWQGYEDSVRQFEFDGLEEQCNRNAYSGMESIISQN